MKGRLYTLGFSAVLGTVCALLLTAAAEFTAPYKAANEKAEEFLNILIALNVPMTQDLSSEQMVKIFDENVRDRDGDKMVYIYTPGEAEYRLEAIALRFSGPGLWAPIKGFLALDSDMRTIRGITFYEQEETPGLGGEIAASWFRDQFVGKSIVDDNGNAGIVIRGGGVALVNGVDAITGATMTCDKVEEMLNEVIRNIVEENVSDGR